MNRTTTLALAVALSSCLLGVVASCGATNTTIPAESEKAQKNIEQDETVNKLRQSTTTFFGHDAAAPAASSAPAPSASTK